MQRGLLDDPVRLRMMGLLYKHRDVAARSVKTSLGLTDGNLASHAARLEAAGLMRSRRALMPTGFEVRYSITPEGSQHFREQLRALRRFLEENLPLSRSISSPEPD